MFKNKFNFSLFLAFMLSKANHVAIKLKEQPLQHDFLENILKPAQDFFNFFGIDKVKALPIFNLGYGFEGTAHTLNFLLTYTPVFFFIFAVLFNFQNLTLVVNFVKEKLQILKLKKQLRAKNIKTKNEKYKPDLVFLLYLKITGQWQEFQKLPDYQNPKILKKLETARKQFLIELVTT